MSHRKLFGEVLAAGALLIGTILVPSAYGETGTSSEARSDVIEEVVVTAQKRSQALEDVPLSVQGFQGQALENSSIRDFNEVITFVPGASEELSSSVGLRQYQIRGVPQGSGDPTVGYYVDDAAFFIYGARSAPMGRTFDLERVEVLRGPQSTLYGNGSMGGTVRYITREPDLEEVKGRVVAGYSSVDGGDAGGYLDGSISFPVVENVLGLSLTGSREDLGGYADSRDLTIRDFNEAEISNWRANLLWTPSDSVEVKLMYLKNKAEQDSGTTLDSLDPAVSSGLPGDFVDSEFDLLSGTLTWEFDGFALSSTTTVIDLQTAAVSSLSFPVPGGLLVWDRTSDAEALNNETRLFSTGDSQLQWMVGVFYSDTEQDQSNSFQPAVIPPSLQVLKSDALSVFAEVSYAFLDDTLIALVGARYFEDDRKLTDSSFVQQLDEETFDSVNPRFNLSWFPDEQSHYYLNIAKGFRSGGYNIPSVCALHVLGGLPCETSIDSDELWSYEIGAKRTLADGQVSLDLAVYYQDWKDSRQFVPVFGLFQDYQVGDAESYGLDIGIVYAPSAVEGLMLRLSANVNESEWTDFTPAIEASNPVSDGDRLPFVPDWTVALSVDYSWELRSGWQGLVNVAYNHLEPQLGQFASNSEGDPRDLVRLRVGFENERYGIYFFGKNLLGEDGAIYSQTPSGGLSVFTQDYPRQAGVEVQLNF